VILRIHISRETPEGSLFLSKYIVIVPIVMQFQEKEIQRMIHACQYYRSMIGSQNKKLYSQYDSLIHKLHNYEQEMECPDCWHPDSVCNIH